MSETGMGPWFGDPDHYDRFAGRFGRSLWAGVTEDVAALGLPDGALVVDVGTGPGRLPVALARRCPGLRVVGVDVSPRMVQKARRSVAAAGVDVSVQVGDVAALPFADASVELVVSTLSQHHWADLAAGLRDLSRVLAPGGRLWVYDVRLALRTALVASRVAFGDREVRMEPVRAGRVLRRVLGRLTVDPVPVGRSAGA